MNKSIKLDELHVAVNRVLQEKKNQRRILEENSQNSISQPNSKQRIHLHDETNYLRTDKPKDTMKMPIRRSHTLEEDFFTPGSNDDTATISTINLTDDISPSQHLSIRGLTNYTHAEPAKPSSQRPAQRRSSAASDFTEDDSPPPDETSSSLSSYELAAYVNQIPSPAMIRNLVQQVYKLKSSLKQANVNLLRSNEARKIAQVELQHKDKLLEECKSEVKFLRQTNKKLTERLRKAETSHLEAISQLANELEERQNEVIALRTQVIRHGAATRPRKLSSSSTIPPPSAPHSQANSRRTVVATYTPKPRRAAATPKGDEVLLSLAKTLASGKKLTHQDLVRMALEIDSENDNKNNTSLDPSSSEVLDEFEQRSLLVSSPHLNIRVASRASVDSPSRPDDHNASPPRQSPKQERIPTEDQSAYERAVRISEDVRRPRSTASTINYEIGSQPTKLQQLLSNAQKLSGEARMRVQEHYDNRNSYERQLYPPDLFKSSTLN